MQVLLQAQRNSNNLSIKRNKCLHFGQFKNIFEISYSAILNNKESINMKYQRNQ